MNVEHVSLYSFRSTRLWIAILLTLGFYLSVSMRVNLSMAVTCMVNSTAYPDVVVEKSNGDEKRSSTGTCGAIDYNSTESVALSGYNGNLLWDRKMQSLLFSATFYGGLLTITASGYMADRFGPKFILLAAMFDYVLVTALTPTLANWSYEAYFGSRVFMGLGEGFVIPSLASITGKWFAPTEKSTIAAMYTSGNQLASAGTSVIAAALCSSSFGWPSIFYLYACLGLVWALIWYLVATNDPHDNKCISDQEKTFLASVVVAKPVNSKKHNVPWRALLTSRPLIAAIFCQFAFNFSAALLQAFLPTYNKEVLQLPLSKNGLFNSVPFIAQLVAKNFLGNFADYLKRNNLVGQTKCVKFFQFFSGFGTASALFGLAFFARCDRLYLALVCLFFYGMFLGGAICGFFTSLLSLAPAHSGTLTSIAMTLGTVGNLVGPTILGIVHDMEPGAKWTFIFSLAAASNVISSIIFMIFGSAEVQAWALPTKPQIVVQQCSIEEKRSTTSE